jgi:hypothetical protein
MKRDKHISANSSIRGLAQVAADDTFGTTADCPFRTTRSAPSALQTSDHLDAIISPVMQEHLDNFERHVLGGRPARPGMERDIGKEAR